MRRSHAHEIAYVGRQQENGYNSSLSSTTGPRPPAMVHGQPAHGRPAHNTASSGLDLNRTRTAAATAAAAWKQPTGVSSKGRAPASLQRSSGVITTSCTRKPVRLEPLFEDDRVCVNILVCSCLDLSGLVLE